jgi:serine phosphatase RsbU (regulator of sigma subunit)
MKRIDLPLAEAEGHQFVCSEVWGGNRPIETAVALPGLRGKVYSRPVGGSRGGDVHFLSACDSGVLARACLADVAGHGDEVAAVSSEIHRLLKRFVNLSDQRVFLQALNRRLAEGELSVMTTAVALSYYPTNRSLSVSYAGHPPALFFDHQRGSWESLSAPAATGLADLPMGVDPDTSFARRRLRAAPGDRVAVFTDGVLEAPAFRAPGGSDGAIVTEKPELFGIQRVVEFFNQERDRSPAQLVDGLIERLVEFTRDPALHHDDVSVMVLEIVPSEGGPLLWKALRNRVVRPMLGRPKAPAL